MCIKRTMDGEHREAQRERGNSPLDNLFPQRVYGGDQSTDVTNEGQNYRIIQVAKNGRPDVL